MPVPGPARKGRQCQRMIGRHRSPAAPKPEEGQATGDQLPECTLRTPTRTGIAPYCLWEPPPVTAARLHRPDVQRETSPLFFSSSRDERQ